MRRVKITVRNTHFVVDAPPLLYGSFMAKFNNNLVTFKTLYNPRTRKMTTSEDRRFYYRLSDRVCHYSIQLLSTFIKRFVKAGYDRDRVDVKYDRDVNTLPINATVADGLSDRDHQPVYINKALETAPMVLVDLKTGKGKTYISMRVVTELGDVTAIIILSRYIDKWIGDITELTTADESDIYVVKGKDSLRKLVESEERYDFVIFSLSTLRNYIKAYDDESGDIDVAPEDLFSHLGIGTVINDEVHQSFHAVYMTTIRLNPCRVIALSATLDNLDKGMTNVYETLYPTDVRCGNLVTFDAHPVVIAVNYNIDNVDRVKYVGPRGYSHTIFEQWLMRRSMFRDAYLEMLLSYVHKGYISRRTKGDKLLVLVQTVDMATLLTNFLKTKYRKLVINRYVEEDPYDNIIDSDICVSTNLSAGTALDIPKLITVIQTVSMRSLQANVQALGRLREIRGKEVRYYYTYSSDISNQYRLHEVRKSVIGHLAKKYLYENYNKRFRA